MNSGQTCGRGALVFAALLALSISVRADDALAENLVDKAGISRGLCVIVGGAGNGLALSVVASSQFLVHALDADPAAADTARALAVDRGLDIARVIFETAPPGYLPHADNTVDLVLAVDLSTEEEAALSPAEILRVLRPNGRAIVGKSASVNAGSWRPKWTRGSDRWEAVKDDDGAWLVLTKPVPSGMDDWSHWEHGPDNNPVSTDTQIRAPYRSQFFATPYYIAMPAVTTAAAGRTFTAMGHIAHHEREEEWLNTLLARNGYNGLELWRRRLPSDYLVHRSAFVATPDVFYMIAPGGDGCLMLDPESGREIGRIRVPEVRGAWKWMAIQDGVLYALAGVEADPAETTVVRSTFPAWSWGELSQGYYQRPRIPWGFGETVLAYDLRKERLAWTHESENALDSRAMAIGGGKVFLYAPDGGITCLDAATGAMVWHNGDADLRSLIEAPGRGLGSTPGFRTTCFCIYTPDALFYEAQTRQNIVAVSLEDGSLMWHRGKTTNNPNVIYLDGKILVGIGPEGNTLLLDPKTGETIEDLGFRKRSCVRLTATPDSIFCRGWPEGLTRYDRKAGTVQFDGSVRPACNDGVIGANGLLYIGPWLCDCNLSLMGTLALCSAPAEPVAVADNALTVYTGDLTSVAGFDSDENDWDAYRGGGAHSGSSGASVEAPLHPLWTWHPRQAFAPTAPTAAGGLVFFSGDDGVVRALDAATGAERWTYATAGPVVQPPTLWEGRAFIGSGDGYVYTFEAATGRLLWRFRAAPVERRIMVYGRLCSTWPVNSGVLVHDGVAYFAAGIIDYDGTYVYALDARTGDVRWRNDSTGHLDPSLRKGVSAQGNLAVMDGALWMAGGNLVSPAKYDLATGEYLGPPPGDGSPRTNRGEEIGVLGGDFLVFGGRLRYSASGNVVNPGSFAMASEPGQEFGLARGRSVPAWDESLMVFTANREAPPSAYPAPQLLDHMRKSEVRTLPGPPTWTAGDLAGSQTIGLALSKDVVVAACRTPQPRNLTPRWRVCLLDRADGSLLSEHDLWRPLRPNGLALDRDGRVLVAGADGSLACLGGRATFHVRLTELLRLAKDEAHKEWAVGQVMEALDSVHDAQSRTEIIDGLAQLGIDVMAGPREAGCVTRWRVLGPFAWGDGNPLDEQFIREREVRVGKPVRTGDTELHWEPYISTHPTGFVDLVPVYGPRAACVAYAYAEVVFDEPSDVLLKIGTNDGFKCWFNGEVAGRFDGGRGYVADQDTLQVRTKPGVNTILLKVSQMGAGWGLGVRITDTEGQPLALNVGTP